MRGTKERAATMDRPTHVLPAKKEQPNNPSEFSAQAQKLSARFGVSLSHARVILDLLRGGAA